jgi:hypothetical protein
MSRTLMTNAAWAIGGAMLLGSWFAAYSMGRSSVHIPEPPPPPPDLSSLVTAQRIQIKTLELSHQGLRDTCAKLAKLSDLCQRESAATTGMLFFLTVNASDRIREQLLKLDGKPMPADIQPNAEHGYEEMSGRCKELLAEIWPLRRECTSSMKTLGITVPEWTFRGKDDE